MALGIRYSYGVFFVAIVGEYGWSRGATAGAFSIAMITHALFAPVTGTLIERYGPRKLFPLGALFLTLGLVAAGRIGSLWHLYLFFGVIIASGINTLSYSPHMSIIPKWFVRRRGLASGLVLSGIGMGTMALAPLCETLIESLGWRAAFIVLAGILLLLLISGRTSPWVLYGFVVLYGLGYGSILPVTAGATGDLFPGNSLGRILAIQSVGFGLGGALGPYLGGYYHDLTGSYFIPFLIAAFSVALAVCGIWMAAPRHVRR